MATALALKGVNKTFADSAKPTVVLKNITLDITAGEFFVMVGPSGSGKSTVLRLMSGLETDYTGTITLGAGYTPADMSFVFQQFGLLPWLTVFANVELGLLAQGVLAAHRHTLVMKELQQFGLEKFAHAHPRELSGGMRQRVGLARALVTNPKIIFMDEPFSELDSFTAHELRQELLRVWQQRKQTIVMVTHLIDEALELADRIAVLTPLPGMIEKIVVNPLPRPRRMRSPELFALEDTLYALIRPE